MLTLTTNVGTEARSVWYNTPVSTLAFTASFTYQVGSGSSNPPADGFAFVFQNQGLSALGGNGGGKGYTGITPSVALLFNIYTGGTPAGVVGTTLQVNGANPADSAYNSSAPVSFGNGDLINVTLSYNGTTLTVTLTDPTAGTTYTTNFTINLAAQLGATAFMGFTGGTGGANSNQFISNFSYVPQAPLILNNNQALGTGMVTLSGGSLLPTGGPVTLANPIQFASPTGAVEVSVLGPNHLTFSGPTALLSNTVLNLGGSSGTLALSGTVSGPGSLTVNGTTGQTINTGTLVLSGQNTFAAGLTLNGGSLSVGSSSTVTGGVLVSGPVGTGTLTLNGGTLQGVTANQSLANNVTLNATGAGVAFGGTNLTFNGLATLTASSTLVVNNTTTFANTITFTPNSSTFGLTQSGTGNLILSANNDYNGNTVVSGGTLTLTGTGALLSSPNLVVNRGGAFTLDYTGTNSGTSLGTNNGLILNGGTVNFLGNASAASAQTVGAILLNNGTSTINVTPGTGQSAVLTAGVLDRVVGATLALPSTIGSTSSKLLFTTAPTLTNGILSFVTVGGTDVGVYGANGLAANASYVNNLTSGATSNVKLTTATTFALTGNTTINSLTLSAGATIDLAGFTLTIGSGELDNASGAAVTVLSSTGTGTVAFGNTDGIITTAGSGSTTFNASVKLTGSSGLTVAGAGTLTVLGSSTITGANAVQTIVLNGAATGGTFTLTYTTPGGTVQPTGAITFSATAATLAANIQAALGALAGIGASGVLVTAVNANTFTVTFQNFLSGAPVLPLSINTQNLTVAGTVTATVGTTTPGANALNLDGGTLVVGNSSLISGGLNVTSGTLQTTPTLTSGLFLPYLTSLNNASLTLGGSNNLILAGQIALGGTNNTITVTNSNATVMSGTVSGPGNLILAGGTLILSGLNTNYTGETMINAGGFQAQSASALGTGQVVVANNASLLLLGSFTMANALVLNGSGPAGNGAVENLIGGNNTLSGTVTLTGNTTLGADGPNTLTLSNTIQGGATLTKVGVGPVALSGANTFTGGVTVATGVLQAASATALGNILSGTTVASGATLQLTGAANLVYAGYALTLNGTGYGLNGIVGQGALVDSTAAGHTWTGNVVLNTNASISQSVTANTLTISGIVSGSASQSDQGRARRRHPYQRQHLDRQH